MKAVDGLRVVLYEGASAVPLDSARRFDVMRLLLERGYAVTRTRQGGHVSDAATGTLVVLGQFAERRPPEDQLAPSGVQVYCREIDGLAAPQVVELVESLRREVQAPEPKAWKPWFPVIDYNRCTNCMQCLSFCLFDVYSVSPDGKIQVQHQSNCKTDCPACSRVCPEVAILFPKYKAGPINGEEINPDDVRPRGHEGRYLGAAGGRHLRRPARPQRESQVAVLERARRRAGTQGAPALPGQAATTDGYSARSTCFVAIARPDSGESGRCSSPCCRGIGTHRRNGQL